MSRTRWKFCGMGTVLRSRNDTLPCAIARNRSRASRGLQQAPGGRLTAVGACETLPVGTQTMRVTAKGEYATRAVLHLALQYPEVVTIHEIAARHRIPLKYLEQILLELKRGGILESRRGVNGGYTLARAPEKISVGEVLRIVDGAFAESSCIHNEMLGGVC